MQLLAWLTCLSSLLGAGLAGWPQGGRNLPAERGCCKRQRRLVFLGHDLSGSPINVDVGLCRSLCGRGTKSPPSGCPGLPREPSRLDFQQTPEERPSQWPARTRGDPHSQGCCPPGSRCQPSRLLVQEHWLRDGPRRLDVVEGCQCNASPEECLRSPALKTFFPDSPLEQTLDVGRCAGPPPSQGGPFCVPTGFDSVLLQGPNGKRLVRILGGCRVQGASCYRVPHWGHYSEVVLDTEGRRLEQRKEIDLGRCLGGCPWREPGGPRAAANHCTPHGYQTKTFQSRTGQLRTIFVIQTCKCGPKWTAAPPPLPHLWRGKKGQREQPWPPPPLLGAPVPPSKEKSGV